MGSRGTLTDGGPSNGDGDEISSGLGGTGAVGPHALEEKDFDSQVIQAEVPVLVVFTADWCAPCKWLRPYLDEVASQARSRVLIFLLDVDRSPELLQRYQVASLPTVILMKRGKEVDRSLGVEPERLRAWVAPFLTFQDGRN